METLIRTFKTQVYLSEDQEQLLKMLFGLSRAVYNHALDLVKSKAVRNNVYEMLKYIYDEIDSGTMESRKVPGLYFAGEVMDIDGPTGGYNISLAFATANLAVESIGRKLHGQS